MISASEPIGVTVDSINGHVYWTEYTAKKIYRCNLNGTGKLLILTDVDALYAITLDHRNTLVYIFYFYLYATEKNTIHYIYQFKFRSTSSFFFKFFLCISFKKLDQKYRLL